MPYILSPPIVINSEIMWQEGPVYEKENIYKIEKNKIPPVNYDLHKIKSHSLTHAEGSLHVTENGKSIDDYFIKGNYFYGDCVVVKLTGDNYKLIDQSKNIFHWEVSLVELKKNLERLDKSYSSKGPEKLILSTRDYPINNQGYHDPSYVLTLSIEAAEFLISNEKFNLYGTSWKSSDFKPGSMERPIHKTLFNNAVIFELLDLRNVPEGNYFFVGFPLRIQGASESPVTPVLFDYNELKK